MAEYPTAFGTVNSDLAIRIADSCMTLDRKECQRYISREVNEELPVTYLRIGHQHQRKLHVQVLRG